MRHVLAIAFLILPLPVLAGPVDDVLDHHILPRLERLASETALLSTVAEQHCDGPSALLQAAFNRSVDAWIGGSHLRFGPSEEENRAFALAFWPDSRGLTPRSLTVLLTQEDPIGLDPVAYREMSIAARGFYALEFLIFDPDISTSGSEAYRCVLIQTVAADIAYTSMEIYDDWVSRYADLMRNAGENDRYQSEDEAVRALLGALSTGLEFTADMRLGRPLGTFDRPQPQRAEMRRSERSLANVRESIAALGELAVLLAGENDPLSANLSIAFARAISRADIIDDPDFSGVAMPGQRVRIEALQRQVRDLRELVNTQLAPELGVAAGFNSLDGD